MRGRPARLAAACAAVLLSMSMLAMPTHAWEKEQQALNNVLEQDDTVCTPVNVKLPTVTKMVEGKNAPKERFTFVLKGKNGAPMPEEAGGSRYTVSRKGKGSVSFGSITFEKSGTYVYTIYEVEGDDLNWTYDDTEYMLTITVKKDGDTLTAETSIKKDGTRAKKIVFTNTYEEIDLNEKITISGQKSWNHGTNPKENRPDQIIVMIYADGKLTQQKEVTEKTEWRYSFTVPKYTKTGEKILYTVDEADVTDYSKKINGYDITNTYVGTNGSVQPGDPTQPTEPTNPTNPATPSTDPSKPVTPSKPPKTGDEFPLTLWLVLGAVGLCGFIAVMVALHRTKHNTYQGKRLKKKGKRLMKKRRQNA